MFGGVKGNGIAIPISVSEVRKSLGFGGRSNESGIFGATKSS